MNVQLSPRHELKFKYPNGRLFVFQFDLIKVGNNPILYRVSGRGTGVTGAHVSGQFHTRAERKAFVRVHVSRLGIVGI